MSSLQPASFFGSKLSSMLHYPVSCQPRRHPLFPPQCTWLAAPFNMNRRKKTCMRNVFIQIVKKKIKIKKKGMSDHLVTIVDALGGILHLAGVVFQFTNQQQKKILLLFFSVSLLFISISLKNKIFPQVGKNWKMSWLTAAQSPKLCKSRKWAD